jgi:hypothetical protein
MVDSNLIDAVPAVRSRVRASRHYPPRYVFAKKPAVPAKKKAAAACGHCGSPSQGWLEETLGNCRSRRFSRYPY